MTSAPLSFPDFAAKLDSLEGLHARVFEWAAQNHYKNDVDIAKGVKATLAETRNALHTLVGQGMLETVEQAGARLYRPAPIAEEEPPRMAATQRRAPPPPPAFTFDQLRAVAWDPAHPRHERVWALVRDLIERAPDAVDLSEKLGLKDGAEALA